MLQLTDPRLSYGLPGLDHNQHRVAAFLICGLPVRAPQEVCPNCRTSRRQLLAFALR